MRDTVVLAIVGPTAVGKTALAEELACRLSGEIISADSMQVYRHMDVGTAKPPILKRRVPYHCIDIVDPGTPFSAALYQRESRRAITECAGRGAVPILCGGTGLYVRAAVDDFDFPSGEQLMNPARAQYEELARTLGGGHLHALLSNRDPASARLIHPNNVRRVIRALEMADEGVSYAEQSAGLINRKSVYDTRFLGVTMPRRLLYERIDDRVDEMMLGGLAEEVDRLLTAGFRSALTSGQAIGYKELVPVIDGTAELDDAVAAIKQASRRYAKRQLTWFRADPRIAWIDADGLTVDSQADAALHALHLHDFGF